VEDVLSNGEVEPVWDTWEEHFGEILAYPPLYASEDLIWLDAESGQEVALAELAKRHS
jgi:hypothetical protein